MGKALCRGSRLLMIGGVWAGMGEARCKWGCGLLFSPKEGCSGMGSGCLR
jgi:hypothetical protein